jgi:hypothetical protein
VSEKPNGYDATMQLADERPELLPLLRVIFTLGDKGFNEGLEELERRGLLVTFPRPVGLPPA